MTKSHFFSKRVKRDVTSPQRKEISLAQGKRAARAKIAFFALRDEKNRRFVS